MKDCNLIQIDARPAIGSIVSLTDSKMNAWVGGFNTAEELDTLRLLANQAMSRVEYESGLCIGVRTFELEVNNYPDGEAWPIYPIVSITKIETKSVDDGTYSVLSADKYRLVEKSDKLKVLIFEDGLPPINIDRPDAVKITFEAGVDVAAELPAMLMGYLRTYLRTYFRDKMPSEVKQAEDGMSRMINNLKLPWL